MKTITANQHIALTVNQNSSFPLFAKPGESQAKAIGRLMARIKRRATAQDPRIFPVGMNSTKAYVESYYRLNNLGTPPFLNLSTAPVDYEIDEAVVCEESDLV